jgi:hypothetical protein
MENKLNRKDQLLFGGMSLILTIFTIAYTAFYFFNPTKVFLSSFIGLVLGLPFKILNWIFVLINQFGISNAVATWLGALMQYIAPIAGFFLWLLIFYILAKLTKRLFKTQNIWYTNIIATVFVGLFLISFIVYSFGLTYYPKDSSLFDFGTKTYTNK